MQETHWPRPRCSADPTRPLAPLFLLLRPRLSHPNLNVATTTAAAVWGLATTAQSRRALADLDIVSLLLLNIKRTFKVGEGRTTCCIEG